MLRVVSVVLVVLGFSTVASAQPQLSVSASEVPSGGTITATITGTPGLYWALVGSYRDNGLVYGGVSLAVGTDAQVLASGFFDPSGTVNVPMTPPLVNGVDTYFLLAVSSAAANFIPPTPSNPIALRPRGLYANAPTFANGLQAGGARITSVGTPTAPSDAATRSYVDTAVVTGYGTNPVFAAGLSAGGALITNVGSPATPTDAANKDYVDTSAVRLAPPATQSRATSGAMIDIEQTGSGPELLSLRTNSNTFPGANGSSLNRQVFRVQPDGSFVARGVLGIGVVPMTGAGERLQWHSYKAAFRAGSIGSGGDQWDDPNTGFYTWAGGYNTIATGLSAFAMGYLAQATGSYSTSLGYNTMATGTGAIAMGYRSAACSSYGLALGQRASTASAPTSVDQCAGTTHTGAMVFADASTTNYVPASANNQFTVRAAGGYRLFTNSSLTTGVSLAAGGASWAVISDRNAKYAFEPVDERDILRRLMALPISTFQYKDGDGRRYIGPVAQDFQAAFQFDDDDTRILMNDIDGVSLASIKALGAELAALREANRQLIADQARSTQETVELRRQLADVVKRLGEMEQRQR